MTTDATDTTPNETRSRLRRAWRYIRIPLVALSGLVTACTSALFIAVYAFSYPAHLLDPDRGGPLTITDRNGTELRSVPSDDGRPGRENWVRLSDIPSIAVLAVVESEDQDFYRHGGVDGLSIGRALWLDIKAGRFAYGGSTITMQLARMMHSSGQPRTLRNKVKEAVLALRMERAVSKQTILENYLNRAYYGNGAYGFEAAARLYFGKPATGLSVAEATFLAILPRAPTAYNPLKHFDTALRRRDYVLDMLVSRDVISRQAAERARAQTLSPALHKPAFLAGHFTEYVLSQIPNHVRARGGVVRTTLDLSLQQQLEHRTREHVAGMRSSDMRQAGVIVLDSQTGDILAMVGSADFDGPDGQVDIVTRRRHPGSALKPFVYGLAIEAGDNPASIAYDIYTDSTDYHVVNRSQPERGPVRYREALAGSYNMAAIDVLRRVGVANLMSTLRAAGVGALDGSPDEYGLRLALGSAKVRLLDLASAYGFLVNGGRVRDASAIIDVESDQGTNWKPALPPETVVFSADTSWLVMDMLADAEARRKVFGHELPLDLPYRVAAKTGTARGFADTVAVGVTSEYTVAAWAGNFDGRPTQGLVAMESAAPLVRDGLLIAARGAALTLTERPASVVAAEVCPLSGKAPSPDCPHRKRDFFVSGRQPSVTGDICDWHDHSGDRLVVHYPDEAAEWAHRQRTRGGRHF